MESIFSHIDECVSCPDRCKGTEWLAFRHFAVRDGQRADSQAALPDNRKLLRRVILQGCIVQADSPPCWSHFVFPRSAVEYTEWVTLAKLATSWNIYNSLRNVDPSMTWHLKSNASCYLVTCTSDHTQYHPPSEICSVVPGATLNRVTGSHADSANDSSRHKLVLTMLFKVFGNINPERKFLFIIG